jgi:hypothetical protein
MCIHPILTTEGITKRRLENLPLELMKAECFGDTESFLIPKLSESLLTGSAGIEDVGDVERMLN